MKQSDGVHTLVRKPKAARRFGRLRFLFTSILVLLGLVLSGRLWADTISGTVKDPSGAVVVGARIEITDGELSQPLVLTSDSSGQFTAPNLKPGKYSIRVTKDAFEEFVTTVELKGAADIPANLTIAAQQAQVDVTEKSSAFANSDAAYRQLRSVGLGDSFRCENFALNMDVGTFQFRSGTITLLSLVNRFETGAIFIGQGHFTLKPFGTIETREMIRRAGREAAEEEFTEVVFRFSGNEFPEITSALGTKTETPPEAAVVLQHWKDRVRHRHEVPQGFTQAFLEVRRSTTSTPTYSRQSTIRNIRRFSTLTSTAFRTRTCGSLSVRAWARCPKWILPRK